MRTSFHVGAKTLGISLVVGFIAACIVPRSIERLEEFYTLHISDRPEQLYSRGTAYLDAEYPHRYDLGRAQMFFRRTLELDPRYPHARHQLARIAFLKGDFSLALKYINQEIRQQGEHASLSSYYVKGLILGYMDRFEEAAESYAVFLRTDPTNWAAQNDYAWVLLKLHRYGTALKALDTALVYWPENAWLHSNRATALFELGRLDEARRAAQYAVDFSKKVNEKDWLHAYPGNDPKIAAQGVAALQDAAQKNLKIIDDAITNR